VCRKSIGIVVLLGFTILGFGQQGKQEGALAARDLCLEGLRQAASPAGTEKSVPLGLKYSILLRQPDSRYIAVDPQEKFKSGDRIRLSLEVNGAGYLYIVHRGSSGLWTGLFPPQDVSGENHAVQKGIKYEIPAALAWAFDQHPGIEKLFIVFSRQPQPSLEGMVDSIKGGADAQSGKPSSAPGHSEKPGRVDDSLVTQMSQLYSRDLKLDTANEKDSANQTVPAVYTVNPSGSLDAVVVKEVDLVHE